MSFLSARRLFAGAVLITAPVLLSSCGNTYRATVGISNPPPSPSQTEYLPVVISQVTSGNTQSQGLASILDASGDSLLVQVHVGQQPVSLALGTGGSQAYVVNLAAQVGNYYQGSLSSFGVVPTLQDGSVNTSSLNSQTNVFATPSASPAALCLAGTVPNPPVFANGNVIYIGQTGSNYVLPLASNATSTGVPGVLSQLGTKGIITNFAGLTTNERTYAIETASDYIEVLDSTNVAANGSPLISVSIPLAAGTGPNFGIMSPDTTRVFILDCDGTITVFDSQANAIDSIITLPKATTSGAPATAGSPIAADYVNANNVLVTANTNGSPNPAVAGTASIINASRISGTFGSAVTVPVGNNPSGVAVLQDNSRAYVANQDDGTVSVINLTSQTTNPTVIPLTYSYAGSDYACPAAVKDGAGNVVVPGGATQIVASPGTTNQQVFVLCTKPNSAAGGPGGYYLFAIRTYQDTNAPSGQSTAADVVTAAISISGIPQQIRMTPTR